MKDGDILLLENVRFCPGEEENDPELSRALAKLADLYVNDAFRGGPPGPCHYSRNRRISAGCGGFLMQRELVTLGQSLQNPHRPFTAIIGGAKVKDKISVIDNLLDKVDNLLIGGGFLHFLKAKGVEVGQSILEPEKLDQARTFMKKGGTKGGSSSLACGCGGGHVFCSDAPAKLVDVEAIPQDSMGLDIGLKTREVFADVSTPPNW